MRIQRTNHSQFLSAIGTISLWKIKKELCINVVLVYMMLLWLLISTSGDDLALR